MKQFFNVLSFELSNYFKNKGYMITTILFSIILVIGLSLPSFFDMSKLIPQLAPISSEDPSSSVTPDEVIDENKANYVIVDNNNILPDLNTLETAFTNTSISSIVIL